ncbi:hypothetical protein [Bacillus thuringiensis]|nr:hypothetical protein [Bacillus thuringiensis]
MQDDAWLSRPITKSLSDYKARIILKRFNELLGQASVRLTWNLFTTG